MKLKEKFDKFLEENPQTKITALVCRVILEHKYLFITYTDGAYLWELLNEEDLTFAKYIQGKFCICGTMHEYLTDEFRRKEKLKVSSKESS